MAEALGVTADGATGSGEGQGVALREAVRVRGLTMHRRGGTA